MSPAALNALEPSVYRKYKLSDSAGQDTEIQTARQKLKQELDWQDMWHA
jgi:hypothetical protein